MDVMKRVQRDIDLEAARPMCPRRFSSSRCPGALAGLDRRDDPVRGLADRIRNVEVQLGDAVQDTWKAPQMPAGLPCFQSMRRY